MPSIRMKVLQGNATSIKSRNRRSGSNIPKSCKSCRKSKQRCDIPNRSAIEASEEPQPWDLACHRCKVLHLPCIVDYPLDVSSSNQRKSPPGDDMQRQISRGSSHQRDQRHRSSASPPSSSSSNRRGSRIFQYRANERSLRQSNTSSSSIEGRNKNVHLFDPHFQGQVIENHPARQNDKDTDMSEATSWAETDTVTAIRHLRPFPYLTRLCSTQPGFFISKEPSSNIVVDAVCSSTSINLEQYAGHFDWQEMNMHLRCFHLFVPFIQTFHPEGHSLQRVGIWLATCLYLACTRTANISLQVYLLEYLRQQIRICMSRGTGSMSEVASLVVMSMYEPLLITNSADTMHIDGSHMMATATSSLKHLDNNVIPSQMQAFDMTNTSISPIPLLRQCSMVISVALYSNYQIFMGSIHRKLPFLGFSPADIEAMEAFCRMVIGWHRSTDQAEYASILLLLLFRYRTLATFERVSIQQYTQLTTLQDAISDQGEKLLDEMLMKLHDVSTSSLSALQAIRHDLALDNDRCNMYLDYIELDIKQLHTTCQANIQDVCLMLVDKSLGTSTNLSTLAQNVLPDPKKLAFLRILGRERTASCRKMAILLGNFADRWSEADGTSTSSGSSQLLAPPPAYICAMVLPDIKSLCDAAAGFLHLGAAPRNCLQEAQLDLAATLIRSFSKALLTFAHTTGKTSILPLQAKGHCDLFQLVAHIASRTSHAIYEWTANSKGLRSTTKATFNFASRNDVAKSNLMEEEPIESERVVRKISVPYLTQSSRRVSQEDGIPTGLDGLDDIPSINHHHHDNNNVPAVDPVDPNGFVYFENLLQEVLSTPLFGTPTSQSTL